MLKISDTCYTIRRETSQSAYDLTKLCYFLFEFNKNWRSCRYLCVVKLHEVSLTLNEKQKSFFLITHLTNGLSVKGR